MINCTKNEDPVFNSLNWHKRYGIWVTDGQGFNVAATKEYEEFSGLKADPYIGSHIGNLERDGVIDRSVTLMVINQKIPVTIAQTILRTKRKLIVTGSPIYNERGEIILVATCVAPLEKQRENLCKKNMQQPPCIPNLGQVVASSKVMREVMVNAVQAAGFDSTVLISGESGVGKEVIAKVVHYLSPRKNGPFINVNLASIPEELFESELFGYRGGAFTGASRSGKTGFVEAAEGGTIFIDEISELPYHAQVKLLRLLQDREYIMLGDTVARRANIRVIAASNRDIPAMVREGTFRKDLFYRLNVIPIKIPPLRQRQEDVLALINKSLQELRKRYDISKHFSSEALSVLKNFDWPGNVRQLQNVVERLVIYSSQDIITRQQVEFELEREIEKGDPFELKFYWDRPLKDALEEVEKRMIIDAVRRSIGIEEAARLLGIHRTTLVRKMQKHGVPGKM